MNGKVLKGLFSLVLMFSFLNGINAQEKGKKDESDIDSKSRLEFSANYMNNMIFAGRNFGMNGYSIIQSAAYIHKSGLGLTLENYGFSKDAGFLSESDLTASYYKNITPKLSLNLGLTHLFNYSDSAGLFNRLNNAVNVTAGYNLGLFTLSNTVEYNFGQEDGWYDRIGVNREIALFDGDNSSISIEPAFSVEMGTKSVLLRLSHGKKAFKSVFYKKISKANKGKGNTLKSAIISKNSNANTIPATPEETTTTAVDNSFGILSYNITLPITYNVKHFTFTLTPYYAIPVNLTPGETTIAGNPFIVTASITYKLPFGK